MSGSGSSGENKYTDRKRIVRVNPILNNEDVEMGDGGSTKMSTIHGDPIWV